MSFSTLSKLHGKNITGFPKPPFFVKRNNITDGGAWAVGQFMANSSQVGPPHFVGFRKE